MSRKYVGYCESLPFKKGDRVRIKKGTKIWTTRPGERDLIAKATYTVVLHDVYNGYNQNEIQNRSTRNPEVLWAGSGGYWMHADVNDVELAPKENSNG